jgi:MtN3 and saliva related transmembrane protein
MPNLPLIDIIGATGAVLTTLCLLPQALKGLREKETRALSLPATIAFTVGLVLWLVCGLAIGDWPLIGSNVVAARAIAQFDAGNLITKPERHDPSPRLD